MRQGPRHLGRVCTARTHVIVSELRISARQTPDVLHRRLIHTSTIRRADSEKEGRLGWR